MKINNINLQNFINKFPNFLPTVKVLNDNSIPWALGGSGCLYLFGNEREPGDADITVLNSDHDKVDELFNIESYYFKSDTQEVRNSNPYGDKDMQITSSIIFNIKDKTYDCSMNDEMLSHRVEIKYINRNADGDMSDGEGAHNDTKIYVKSPEDVLLVKAILQRGKEESKNDIEDIHNFIKTGYKVYEEYLGSRIQELGAEERVSDVF